MAKAGMPGIIDQAKNTQQAAATGQLPGGPTEMAVASGMIAGATAGASDRVEGTKERVIGPQVTGSAGNEPVGAANTGQHQIGDLSKKSGPAMPMAPKIGAGPQQDVGMQDQAQPTEAIGPAEPVEAVKTPTPLDHMRAIRDNLTSKITISNPPKTTAPVSPGAVNLA